MKEEDIQPTIDAAFDSDTGDEGLPFGDDDTYSYADDPNKAANEAKKKAAAAARAEEEKQRQNDADGDRDAENAAAGGYNVGETSENTAGGRFMNKGGLASRKNKKKK